MEMLKLSPKILALVALGYVSTIADVYNANIAVLGLKLTLKGADTTKIEKLSEGFPDYEHTPSPSSPNASYPSQQQLQKLFPHFPEVQATELLAETGDRRRHLGPKQPPARSLSPISVLAFLGSDKSEKRTEISVKGLKLPNAATATEDTWTDYEARLRKVENDIKNTGSESVLVLESGVQVGRIKFQGECGAHETIYNIIWAFEKSRILGMALEEHFKSSQGLGCVELLTFIQSLNPNVFEFFGVDAESNIKMLSDLKLSASKIIAITEEYKTTLPAGFMAQRHIDVRKYAIVTSNGGATHKIMADAIQSNLQSWGVPAENVSIINESDVNQTSVPKELSDIFGITYTELFKTVAYDLGRGSVHRAMRDLYSQLYAHFFIRKWDVDLREQVAGYDVVVATHNWDENLSLASDGKIMDFILCDSGRNYGNRDRIAARVEFLMQRQTSFLSSKLNILTPYSETGYFEIKVGNSIEVKEQITSKTTSWPVAPIFYPISSEFYDMESSFNRTDYGIRRDSIVIGVLLSKELDPVVKRMLAEIAVMYENRIAELPKIDIVMLAASTEVAQRLLPDTITEWKQNIPLSLKNPDPEKLSSNVWAKVQESVKVICSSRLNRSEMAKFLFTATGMIGNGGLFFNEVILTNVLPGIFPSSDFSWEYQNYNELMQTKVGAFILETPQSTAADDASRITRSKPVSLSEYIAKAIEHFRLPKHNVKYREAIQDKLHGLQDGSEVVDRLTKYAFSKEVVYQK